MGKVLTAALLAVLCPQDRYWHLPEVTSPMPERSGGASERQALASRR